MTYLPQLSVVMASYNAACSISSAISSVIQQTISDWELIIVDDCSSDNTQEIVEAYSKNDARIIYERLPVNRGPGVARNIAIDRSKGVWIVILDADDTIHPERFAIMTAALENKNADIGFDNLMLVSQQSKPMPLINADVAAQLSCRWTIENYVKFNKPYESSVLIGFLKPVFRSKFLKEMSIKYNEELTNGEDYIIVLESIIRGGCLYYVHSPLYNYCISSSSLSGQFNQNAHNKLLTAERNLLTRYGSQLNLVQQKAICAHVKSLEVAAKTNDIFLAVRHRDVVAFFKILWIDRKNAIVHSKRIVASLTNKFRNSSNRGR